MSTQSSSRARTLRGWAIVSPDGFIDLSSFARTKREAVFGWMVCSDRDVADTWREYQACGYRVARVEIRESK